MKKILLIAASAMMVFASCTKVNVNYPDNGQPQEIAMFAVNKKATKAAVVDNAFLVGDNMRVSAYLASVAGSTPASYFENILFAKGTSPETMWVAGQYWPISAATLNFVAVTQKGGGVELDASKIVWTNTSGEEKFTVTVDYNTAANAEASQAVEQTIAQSDIMYAYNRASNKGDGTAPGAVGLVFKHALAWINFAFRSNVTTEETLVINSVELFAPYNGTLTVTPANYKETDNTSKPLSVTAAWTNPAFLNLKVTNQSNGLAAVTDLADQAEYTPFGNGMLVVPNTVAYTGNDKPYFVINYSIKQGTEVKPYSYKHDLSTVVWEMGKKYTYNININLHEIKVNPSVEVWDNKDEKGTEETTDDVNWGAEVPLG